MVYDRSEGKVHRHRYRLLSGWEDGREVVELLFWCFSLLNELKGKRISWVWIWRGSADAQRKGNRLKVWVMIRDVIIQVTPVTVIVYFSPVRSHCIEGKSWRINLAKIGILPKDYNEMSTKQMNWKFIHFFNWKKKDIEIRLGKPHHEI